MTKLILSLFLISCFLISFSSAQRFCNGVYCDANCNNCYPCQQEVNCFIASNCFCAKKTIPGGLNVADTPQFVFLTFDDSIEQASYLNPNIFDSMNFILNNPSIKDSVGCSPKISAYLMGDTSDYNMANLFDRIGSISYHTQTHTTNLNTPYNVWKQELSTLKKDLEILGKVKQVKGSRAPYLQPNEAYYTVLQELGVTYDSSLVYGWEFVSPEQKKNFWPFTLDYGVPDQMMCLYFGSCPTQPHSGLWEFPIVSFQNAEFIMDYNVYGDTAATMAAMKQNFLDSYNYNRVPRGYYIHWRYLTNNGDFDAIHVDRKNFLIEFFSWVATLPDIIFTTEDKVIQWIKNPQNKIATKSMSIFQCPDLSFTPKNTCPNGNSICLFKDDPVRVCGKKCPQQKPGLGVDWSYLPTNLALPHWTGNVDLDIYDSWPSGFCGNLFVTHTNNLNALGFIFSMTNLYTSGAASVFYGYPSNGMEIDEEARIMREIGFYITIPANQRTYIGGLCFQTSVPGDYAATPNFVQKRIRFGIDLYSQELSCPLGGCAIECGNGRCDSNLGEDTTTCPFDCLPLETPVRRMLFWDKFNK